MTKAASAAAKDLAAAGVTGVQTAWADNNAIHDTITYAHPGLATPAGDVRLVPVMERLRRLAGQPALASAPGRPVATDGSPRPYCQRAVLERAVTFAFGDRFTLAPPSVTAITERGQQGRRGQRGPCLDVAGGSGALVSGCPGAGFLCPQGNRSAWSVVRAPTQS